MQLQEFQILKPMSSWSDSLLSKVNSFANKLGIAGTILVAVSLLLLYLAGNEMSKRSAEKWRKADEDASNKAERLGKTETELSSAKKQLEHTEKVLAPPTISLESKRIERHSTGICAKLRFKSSKTDSLPTLSFKVKIIEGNSKIIGFDLDIDSPIHQNRNADNFPEISEDGKTATVNFYTLNSTKADIRIDVSAPAKAIITGKYIDSPVTIAIP